MTAPRARAATAAAAGDVAVVVVLLALGLAGFVPAFGGYSFVPAAVAGLVAGTVVGWLGARLRWWPGLVAVAVLLAYLLLAGPLAYRPLLVGGAVPSPASVRASAVGAVTAWKGIVTAATPLSAFPELVVVPLLLGLLGAALGTSFAVRGRRYGWAVAPAVAVLVASLLLGTAQAWHAVPRAAAFGVLAIGWLAWRRAGGAATADDPDAAPSAAADRRALAVRRLRRSAAMLAVVAIVATTAGFALAHADRRYALRQDVVPPLDLRQYASPLEAFRSYVDAQKDTELFDVRGLPAGGRLRLAVLDMYTGTVMDVAGGDRDSATTSGVFERGAVEMADAATTPAGRTATVTVTSVGYTGPWLPTPGVPRVLSFSGAHVGDLTRGLYVNPVTGTSVSTTPVVPGDSFTVDATLPPDMTPDGVGSRTIEPTRQTDPYVVDAAGTVARSLVGAASSPADQLRALRDGLRQGQFSDGLAGQPTSRPGHGADRITTLLTGATMIGDDEQYAVAAALMARSLGYSSRVVMGFYPDPTAPAATGGVTKLTGKDVHAWMEVDVRGVGWVAYDVTPDKNKPPQQQDPRANAAPQPQVLQEPDAAQPPPDVPQAPIADDHRGDKHDDGTAAGLPWGLIGVGTGGSLLVLLPVALVLLAKSRRRKRRRRAPEPVDRVSGGWREVTDTAVDLGTVLPVGATRRETAAGLGERFPDAPTTALAHRADAVVFGGGIPTADDVEAFWREVDGLIGALRRGSSPWQRARAVLSPRSLRLRESVAARWARLTPVFLRKGDARR